MKHYYKISKVKNRAGEKVEYLQVWKGDSKGRGEYIETVGTADKLIKILVRFKQLEILTKKYPDLMTKLCYEETSKMTKGGI